MKAVLLIDFGSTYTKITAVDVEKEKILGTAQSFTTIETDINDGLNNALAILKEQIGEIEFSERYACSSAAGGLRMVAIGLVPELTAKAARQASLGAGAKVIKTYSYELTEGDLQEIDQINPDICLLTGGTDGGNKENIVFNAQMLAKAKHDFPIIIAGNRNCADKCQEILKDKQTYVCENVMPRLDIPNVEPVQKKIREIFLEQNVKAKGLSRAQDLIQGSLMPTPSAMLTAMKLLAKGSQNEDGMGDLVGVDLGGATALVGGKAARVGNLGQQSCVRGTVTDLQRGVQRVHYLTAAVYAVVNCREAVEVWVEVAVGHALFFAADTLSAVFVLVLTGIGVDGGRQQVRLAGILQVLEQLDVIFNQAHAGSWLDQGNAFLFGLVELVGEYFVLRQGFVVGNRLVQVYLAAGRPCGKDLFTNFIKFVVGPFFIFDVNGFHLAFTPLLTPFS